MLFSFFALDALIRLVKLEAFKPRILVGIFVISFARVQDELKACPIANSGFKNYLDGSFGTLLVLHKPGKRPGPTNH